MTRDIEIGGLSSCSIYFMKEFKIREFELIFIIFLNISTLLPVYLLSTVKRLDFFKRAFPDANHIVLNELEFKTSC